MEYGGSLYHRWREPKSSTMLLVSRKQTLSQDLFANDLQKQYFQMNARGNIRSRTEKERKSNKDVSSRTVSVSA